MRSCKVPRGAKILVVCTLVLSLAATCGLVHAQKLTYMLWVGDIASEESTLQMAERFEAAHPGVEVEVLISTTARDHNAKLLTMQAGGVIPDVFLVDRRSQYKLWTDGLIMPITDWVEKDAGLEWDDFVNHEQVTMDGEIIGVPHHGGGQLLAFNRARFAEAGLEQPDESFRSGRWDLDAFLEAARAMTKDSDGDGSPEMFGTMSLHAGHALLSVLRNFGTTLLDPDSGEPAVNTEAGREAIRWIAEMSTVYNVAGGNPTNAGVFLMCPRCAFTGWGTDAYAFEWNIAPYPKGDLGHKNTGGHNFYAISSTTQVPQLAREFIKFNLNPEHISEALRGGAVLTPVRLSTFLDPALIDRYDGLNLDVFMKAANPADFLIPESVKVPYLKDAIDTANTIMEKVIAGELAPEAAAEQIDAEIRR